LVATLDKVVIKSNGAGLMSKATDGNSEGMPKVDVPIVGFERPLPVLITFETPPGTEVIIAPDTRRLKVFFAHDRGANYRGSLRDEFFVCGNSGYENNWTVLWVTLNASQEDDGVQRLQPFCMLASAWQPNDLDNKVAFLIDEFDALELEGLILLWAYANFTARSWDYDFPEAEIKDAAIKREVAALVLQAGASGKPLDLFQLTQKKKEMSEGDNKSETVPHPRQNLLTLVRRGLEDISRSAGKKGRILVVDDERAIVEVTEDILKASGYEVRSTCEALDAIELARSFQPQVAMLGVMMPVMDGVRLGMELASFLPHTKILLWVEVDALEKSDDLQRRGYRFGLFPTPFETEELLNNVKSWLHETTILDSITGFGLPAHLDFILDTEIYRCERYSFDFSIILFDITEHWQQKNAAASSRVRRKLLAEFSYLVTSTCRQIDRAFRYGEGNFALLLPQTSKDSAEELASKLDRSIRETKWDELIGCPVRLSVKCAVVSFPEDGRTKRELLKHADRAMSDDEVTG